MNEQEVRANAMLAILEAQRNEAMNRCAQLAAELAVAQQKVKELTPDSKAEEPK